MMLYVKESLLLWETYEIHKKIVDKMLGILIIRKAICRVTTACQKVKGVLQFFNVDAVTTMSVEHLTDLPEALLHRFGVHCKQVTAACSCIPSHHPYTGKACSTLRSQSVHHKIFIPFYVLTNNSLFLMCSFWIIYLLTLKQFHVKDKSTAFRW